MSGRIIEIQKQALEVRDRFTPNECIYEAPEDKRNQYSDGSTLDKFSGAVMQRELQIAGSHYEKRHTSPY
jgi:hypothetical protein